MSVDKPFVVVCVPAFNEERNIAGVVVQAKRYVDMVVVCDDGSVDLTGVIAEGLRAVGCGIRRYIDGDHEWLRVEG